MMVDLRRRLNKILPKGVPAPMNGIAALRAPLA